MNLLAEDGSEEEYEDEAREEDKDEGWWVGTVGVMETGSGTVLAQIMLLALCCTLCLQA